MAIIFNMSMIEDVKKIDAISIDKETNEVVLNIFDHLDWSDEKKHLQLLQEKVENYIKFIETKEIEQVCPEAKGRKIRFHIQAKYSLLPAGIKWLEETNKTLSVSGHSINHSFLKKTKVEAVS